MKRNFLIFFVCFISMYFLLAGFFGATGFMYNQSLSRQIKNNQLRNEKLEIEINNLKQQKEILASEDGLRDSAIGIGLFVEGDTVYLFDSPSLQDENNMYYDLSEDKLYTPLSVFSLLLIALGISTIVTFVIWLLSKDNSHDNDDLPQIGGDSDLYINA